MGDFARNQRMTCPGIRIDLSGAVGAGPALNVQVHPIRISENETVEFKLIPVIRASGAAPETVRAFAFKDGRFSENITRASHFSKFLFRTHSSEQAKEVTAHHHEFSPVQIEVVVEFTDLIGINRPTTFDIRADEAVGRITVFPKKL